MNRIKRIAYGTWVGTNVKGDGYGKCEAVAKAMHRTFSELEVRKGLFFSAAWGRRGHWWLRTAAGEIVDPTARQHPEGMLFPASDMLYEDLTDLTLEEARAKVPSGVCMDCGKPVYGGDTFCNKDCEAKTMVSLGCEQDGEGRWRNTL